MSTNRDTAAIVGVGAAACAVCCAGPILGFLTAIGLSAIAGVLMFGAVGLAVAAVGVAVVIRRRRAASCTATGTTVAVEIPTIRTPG